MSICKKQTDEQREKLLDNLKDTLIKHDVNSAVVDIGRLALDLEFEFSREKASLRNAVLEAVRKRVPWKRSPTESRFNLREEGEVIEAIKQVFDKPT